MKKFAIFIFALLLNINEFQAQDLPRYFADGEEEKMRDYLQQASSRALSCEPIPEGASFRAMAEWEELEALAITWTSYPSILTNIVKAAQPEVKVIIITNNPTAVSNTLTSAGVDVSFNIEFVNRSFDSVWMRDYGPNTVYRDGVGERAIIDWIYNRPRPLDDTVPEAIADAMNTPIYCTNTAPEDMVHTGGNYMSDGMGRAFSSRLFIEENGPNNEWGFSTHSEADIDAIMDKYMGITSYPKMEALPFDVINHIDMHMKLLDEETLLVGEYPEGVADGPQIEANIQYLLDNFPAPSGLPYKVIRIPMPPDANGDYPDFPGNQWWQAGDYRTYANAVFVNKTIIVPTYEEQYDTTGLRIWQEAMPGYTIAGVNAEQMISALGAIHCITKEIGVDEPLVVNHLRRRSICSDQAVQFTASAKHNSGIAGMNFFYRISGDIEYQSITMENVPGEDEYIVELPAQGNFGSDLEYYFEATANSGKTINRPLPAPVGYFNALLELCAPTANEEIQFKIESKIYPNPASAITAIEFQVDHSFDGKVVLTDVHGRAVRILHDGKMNAGKNQFFFDAQDFASGMYFVELRNENTVLNVSKLLIK